MTEQEAVRDAYVALLERTLRAVAGEPTVPQGIRILAAEVIGAGEVTRIPDGVRLHPRTVTFRRWPTPGGEWHLIGPADQLVPGTVIEVERFNGARAPRDTTLVAVGHIVAERTVIHRDDGPARYVIARVFRAVTEED